MGISSLRDTPHFVLRQMCVNVNSKLANAIIRSDDLTLSKLSIEPSSYTSAEAFKNDYLLVSYLSKYKGLKTGINTKKVALSGFAAAEETCKRTNIRLGKRNTSLHDSGIHRAQRLIAQLLGPLNVPRLLDLGDWGPGATFEFVRTEAYLDRKHAEFPMTVTRSAAHLMSIAISSDPTWSESLLGLRPDGPFSVHPSMFDYVDGCRVDTVPKNAKTDRTIGIEPRGNMFLQKGVGRFFRKLLKRVGVDLDDQSLNQNLASLAQELGLSTIDLSMASDTVCRELVFLLFPLEWAMYLDKIRSKNYLLPRADASLPYEKFSSMGNGFTFELESLIFWSLVRATMDANEGSVQQQRVCAVYGDDIIAPQSVAHELISLLAYCGFTTNVDKTFTEGRFFESCGRHYFDGIDVTPIYQKETIAEDDLLEDIRFYNRLCRYAVKHNDGAKLSAVISPILKRMDKLRRKSWHPQLPFGVEGDDGYLSNHETIKPLGECRNRGLKLQVVRKKRPVLPANDLSLYAYALRQSKSLGIEPHGRIDLESRVDESAVLLRGTTWQSPRWEFYLDL